MVAAGLGYMAAGLGCEVCGGQPLGYEAWFLPGQKAVLEVAWKAALGVAQRAVQWMRHRRECQKRCRSCQSRIVHSWVAKQVSSICVCYQAAGHVRCPAGWSLPLEAAMLGQAKPASGRHLLVAAKPASGRR